MFEKVSSHPSFVQVSFSRCQGNPGPLYGSNVENHTSFVAMRIQTSNVSHEEGRDFYFGDSGKLVEVWLSNSQFATLLTTMNAGGTPATLRTFDGKEVERNPGTVKKRAVQIEEDFRDNVAKLDEKIEQDIKDVWALLAKPNLKKEDRLELGDKLERALVAIKCNLPFALKQFNEATNDITQEATTEIEASMNILVTNLGLKTLQDMGEKARQEIPASVPEQDD